MATESPLGLKKLPRAAVPALTGPHIKSALDDAHSFVQAAPRAWRIVEKPGAGGFGTLDMGFVTERIDLSPSQEKQGREQLERAYDRIDAMLKTLDSQIGGKNGLRMLLIIIGILLIVAALVLFGIAVFYKNQLELTGKGGAGGLLLTTGIGLLSAINAKDRSLRTLTSRIRAQLLACLAKEYAEAQRCMTETLQRLDEEFSTVKRKAEASAGQSGAVEL